MKQFISILFLFIALAIHAQYNVGDKASGFSLKNIDGKIVSLSDYESAKGFIIAFTCNHCPYAKAYQQRLVELDKTFKEKGYPVIAINPNDPEIVPEDSFDEMKKRHKQAGFTFPYLFDETQQVYKKYGAQKTPHIYILKKDGTDLIVKYIGAIDNNYQSAADVTETYVADAVNSLLAGNDPKVKFTKAIGCSIKTK